MYRTTSTSRWEPGTFAGTNPFVRECIGDFASTENWDDSGHDCLDRCTHL